jgi:hypothetical protein
MLSRATVAIVEPALPDEDLPQLFFQIHDFINDIGVQVLNSCSWFHGVGLFKVHSPVAREFLIQHMPWNSGEGRSLRFIKHDEGIGFRSHHGSRKGWLMFIGIPLNFHNTHCIREAVNTFGEFHYWYHTDAELTRTMVYATFPSLVLVPRDVVFR